MSDKAYDAARATIHEQIENTVDLEDARTLFETMVNAVHAVKRTNLFLEDRYALSMRIDASILTTEERPECPFGAFFIHGRDFNGFHVRFRDIARGGVRAIFPRGVEQYSREQERLYDEAYNLAFAQQLKNKDIPEGGSKAALLIHPVDESAEASRHLSTHFSISSPQKRKQHPELLIDYITMKLIYLGPDENITPELIEWVVDRGQRRGYPMPTALMSSKPGAGINHKEYGVTSEGVVVFLDTALRAVGINPETETFTIKMTGGPDGDVGGNCIRILHREYGENAKIVGIADGSGCCEDPQGLDHTELLRLFEEESCPLPTLTRKNLVQMVGSYPSMIRRACIFETHCMIVSKLQMHSYHVVEDPQPFMEATGKTSSKMMARQAVKSLLKAQISFLHQMPEENFQMLVL